MKTNYRNYFTYLLFGLLLCIINPNGHAQGFNTMYGTADANDFKSLVKLPNGDYVVSGTTTSLGNSNLYIARINSSGIIVWQKTVGGNGNEVAYSSIINTNGNIVVAGTSTSYSSNGNTDVLLVEVDIDGNVTWTKNIGSSNNYNDTPNRISLTANGIGVTGTNAITGSNSPDILAFEVSNNGQTINWHKVYNGNGDIGYHIISSSLGGYILVGGSNAGGSGLYDQFVMKLNSNGEIVNTISIGSFDNENAHQVIELPNNDLIVMGNFRALSGSGLDISLVKIKAVDFTIEWAKTYGDNSFGNERAYSFIQTNSGGYAMVGSSTGFGLGSNEGILVVTDANGGIIDYTTIGGTGNDFPVDLIQNQDEGFTVAGYSNTQGAGGLDGYLVRTDNQLNLVGNCSPSSVITRTINPNSSTMNFFNNSTINLTITDIASVSSSINFSSSNVQAFTVTGQNHICFNQPITFSLSKPNVQMNWSNNGNAIVEGVNQNSYTIKFPQLGTYNVSGTYGSCTYSEQVEVQGTTLSFVNLSDLYYVDLSSVTLQASPSGGIFKVNGEEKTVLGLKNPGQYHVEYLFTDENGCKNSIEKDVNIIRSVAGDCGAVNLGLSFVGLLNYYCVGSPDIILDALPIGGVFFVNGAPATTISCLNAATYTVVYAYTNGDGCTESITKVVQVGALQLTTDKNSYCPGEIVLVTATECIAGTFNRYRFYLEGDPIAPSSASNSISIPNLESGNSVYVYAFNTGSSVEEISTPIELQFSIGPPNTVITTPSSNLFCDGSNIDYPVVVTPVSNGGILSGTGINGFNFNPFGLTPGTYTITYSVTLNTCNFDFTKEINVEPSPTVTLVSSDNDNTFCQGTLVTFTASTAGSANRYLFLVNGVGQYGPGTDNSYELTTVADGDIVSVIVDNGENTCALESSSIANTVGESPVVDFKWNALCGGNSSTGYGIEYEDLSSIASGSTIDQWLWDVNNDGTYDYTYIDPINHSPIHNFPAVSEYNTKLTLITNKGCEGNVTKRVFTLEGISITQENPYSMDFSASDGDWDFNGVNSSWAYGSASVFSSTGSVWSTNNGSSTHNVNEKSYLNSPCFDFTDLDKPMIRLSIWSETNLNSGAILQASIDGGVTWFLVGQKGDGLNWYDDSGNNGVDDFPESNSASDAWFGSYGDWTSAAISLQTLAGEPSVRFRIAFGSNAASITTSGFAVGKVWIGNRGRVSMIEHFTDNGNPCGAPSNAVVENIINAIPNDVALINYHKGFSMNDPYSQYAAGSVGSRFLFYGLNRVPSHVVEGTSKYIWGENCEDPGLIQKSLENLSLREQLFDLDLKTEMTPGKIDISVESEYISDVAFDKNTDVAILHVAIIENDADGNPMMDYVYRGELPDAAGTFVSGPTNPYKFYKGETDVKTFQFLHNFSDNAKLGVVAYLQNINYKSVLQATYVFGSTGGVLSNAPMSNVQINDFQLYPNPAQHSTTLAFNGLAQDNYSFQVIDIVGQIVSEGTITSGSSSYTFNLEAMTNGMYTLKLKDSKDQSKLLKLVVSK